MRKQLRSDGTRLKDNAEFRLNGLYKHAGQLVYATKRDGNIFKDMR